MHSNHEPKGDEPRALRWLDRAVEAAHRVRLGGRRYHPYFIATDAGIAALLVFSGWYCSRSSGLVYWRFFLAFAAMQLVYWAYRALKVRLFGARARGRSFLQDAMLVLLPTFATASYFLGNSVGRSLDLAGLDLALGLAFIRVGCFLGGCCYGIPSRRGVQYPAHVLRTESGCRPFTPGELPEGRVLPIQLLEALFNLVVFVGLTRWSLAGQPQPGSILAAYFIAYGAWRVGADTWRRSSVRPRRGGLSEAQWFAATAMCIGAFALFIMARR